LVLAQKKEVEEEKVVEGVEVVVNHVENVELGEDVN
jgi:hypothetical protein